MAAKEGTSELWAGGVGASLECRTVSSRGGSGEEKGNQVTTEKEETGGGVESPPPQNKLPCPCDPRPREGK